jgi:hypothetical protein
VLALIGLLVDNDRYEDVVEMIVIVADDEGNRMFLVR